VVWGMQGDVVDQTAALEEGALAMNTATVVLASLTLLMMQHFVVCLNRGLITLSCLLRSSTAATLVVYSTTSVSVDGPHMVPNPLHSRLTRNPQRLAS
jgi:hypothetical protein